MKTEIIIGDVVMVRSGKDKGKKGKVMQRFPKIGKIVVENVNLIKRHLKAQTKNTKGQIVELSGPIPASKVGLWCDTCAKAVRIKKKLVNGTLVRTCHKCAAEFPKASTK